MPRLKLYKDYIDVFKSIRTALMYFIHLEISNNPLSFSTFNLYCDMSFPTLRTAKEHPYFWNLCTSICNNPAIMDQGYHPYDVLYQLLQKHFLEAQGERQYYCKKLTSSNNVTDSSMNTLFSWSYQETTFTTNNKTAWEALLVTVLKFDMFGIHDINAKQTLYFCCRTVVDSTPDCLSVYGGRSHQKHCQQGYWPHWQKIEI